MAPISLLVSAFGCFSLAVAGPSYTAHEDRTAAVADAFQRAWDGYYQYAFPHDSLDPTAATGYDDRNGWGASAIDAFSTAIIMSKEDVVKQILDFVPTINFNVDATNNTNGISLFETTIRYLGGLLSAHDLLGDVAANYGSDGNVSAVLDQAQNLANNLAVAFGTSSGIPMNTLFFDPPRLGTDTTNGLATIGTLVLEWTRLSDITGNDTYAALAQKGEDFLLDPLNPDVGEPWPGLLGTDVDISNGSFVDSDGGWVGGDDSFYEYLIKMYVYDQSRFGHYKDRWIAAADSSIEYLASHPTTRPDLTFMAAYNGKGNLTFVSQHLACFDGGSFILGGLTLNEQKYIDFGLELVAGCHDTYISTATGIGPEVFSWQDNATALNATNNPAAPADQLSFYNTAGFWITDSDYVLRPEVIESFYYAYRATGDSKYQDWAWDAFKNINATCWDNVGFSDVTNVNAPGGGSFTGNQESFWFAEVLKYSYMIQAQEAPWQVSADHDNKYVFNTEAHPVKVAGAPI